MAYLAFYNKYRPQSFDEVVGQKPIVETLKNALREKKIAHAYLFCGPRGTGKTTMARLMAKALNCKEGLGKQCNECDSCKAITRGDHPDVIEIDAASNSTVDSVRDLISNVSYQPIMSPYKVYIIDEVHNMSESAFNALLKTLEEPPSFCVFILATTDPDKIIPTILSRVQRFDFSKVTNQDLVKNMENILKKESIQYDVKALEAVASLSDGGVRDSLSLLDQLVSYSGDKVTLDDVNSLFGLLSKDDELRIMKLIQAEKTEELIALVREKYQKGMDIKRLHNDLISLYKDLILYRTTRSESLLSRLSKEDCVSFPEDNLATLEMDITSLIKSKREYKDADNDLNHFELALLDLILKPSLVQARPTSPAASLSKPESTSQYASKAVEIKPTRANTDFVPKAEEKKDEGLLVFNLDDVCNLMLRAVSAECVEKRKEIAKNWARLEDLSVQQEAYVARSLYGSKLRLLDDEDILLVTNDMISEANKINRKANQEAILKVTRDAFGKEYHVLSVSTKDFNQAIELFKKKRNVEAPKKTSIDFGVKEKKEDSTDFFTSLMSDDE